MLTFIAENLATILICAALLITVTLIVVSLVRSKKKGKSTCGCGCAHCAMSGICHKQSPDK